jgi:DMSO/TMAO reductase YedYZ molybdopterin-dependent catalytic subunit
MPIADTDGFTREEVRLALRNPGLPLEALRHAVTPVGMHYVLVHFDIPAIDSSVHELAVDGRVRTPLALSMSDVRLRPSVSMPVVLECAGGGRAHLAPRPISAPWHDEAVGCAEWTGTPLRGVLQEAGLLDDAVEIVFTGVDRGLDQGVEQDYQRSLPVDEALRDDVLLAYEMNGRPIPPVHGFPLRLVVPEWYGMASVKWLRSITAVAEPFEGVQQSVLYRYRPASPSSSRACATRAPGRSRSRAGRGRATARSAACSSARTAGRRGPTPSSRSRWAATAGPRGRTSGRCPSRATTSCARGRPTPAARRSRWTPRTSGTRAATA